MKWISLIILAAGLMSSTNLLAAESQTCANKVGISAADLGIECTGTYYNWGKAQNGNGYCYQWACTGDALNNGQPVSNYSCEALRPSYYDWSKAQNGWGYCYQYTPYGVVMNQGQPVSNYSCESKSPSYYSWGHGQDGQTHCYQYTSKGAAMNQGQPVSDYYCH
jgi:hypothetical protein